MNCSTSSSQFLLNDNKVSLSTKTFDTEISPAAPNAQ
jgi:hypothetical protein